MKKMLWVEVNKENTSDVENTFGEAERHFWM